MKLAPIYQLMVIAAVLCLPEFVSAQMPTTGATTAEPPGKSAIKADMVAAALPAVLTIILVSGWLNSLQ